MTMTHNCTECDYTAISAAQLKKHIRLTHAAAADNSDGSDNEQQSDSDTEETLSAVREKAEKLRQSKP